MITSNFFFNNPYLITGLDWKSNAAAIDRRRRELLRFANIKRTKTYDHDFPFLRYEILRTKESIEHAYTALSNPKQRILHSFLWFQITDKNDENAYAYYQEGNLEIPIIMRQTLYRTTKDLHYAKNYLLAQLLNYEYHKGNNLSGEELDDIIRMFVSLYDNQKHREIFVEDYNKHNVIKYNANAFSNIPKDLNKVVLEYFFHLSIRLKKKEPYHYCSKLRGMGQFNDIRNRSRFMQNFQEYVDLIQRLQDSTASGTGYSNTLHLITPYLKNIAKKRDDLKRINPFRYKKTLYLINQVARITLESTQSSLDWEQKTQNLIFLYKQLKALDLIGGLEREFKAQISLMTKDFSKEVNYVNN